MCKEKVRGALVVTLLATAGVRADDSGFYLGASVGEATQSSVGFDGKDTSFRLLGVYSFPTDHGGCPLWWTSRPCAANCYAAGGHT